MNTDLSAQDLLKIATGMRNNRLLRLVFPQSDASCNILLANCIEGDEYLSHDFRFVAEILSDSAELDPKDFIDKMITRRLARRPLRRSSRQRIFACKRCKFSTGEHYHTFDDELKAFNSTIRGWTCTSA
ncbi:MAG TPA: hypothetical protein VGL01_16005 [Trinickia sp.]|jgi:hypothetical protein|uniref:hypothetical protein n=1 Tax=Trinickia sp. TaxID=2571163 RepID=UPI002F3FD210